MNIKEKKITVIWLKRIIVVIAFLLWLYAINIILKSQETFQEQVPYCMGSTMLIFMGLSMVYKGLDYWSLKNKS